MIKALDDDNWAHIFKMCCGERNDSHLGSGPVRPPISSVIGHQTSVAHFTRNDVSVVVAKSDGENYGPSWLALVKLKDGRFVFIEAGCDYTGWDCMGNHGVCMVGPSLEVMLRLGLTDDARARLSEQIAAHLTGTP